jgi:nucleoside-diphosphate-sugar epimerase
MPHTLVTGANGFVAAHVIDQLIDAGHHVTGSLRSASNGASILATHPEWKDHLDFVGVPDYTTPDVWDDVFKNGRFDYVIHVAAPVFDNPNNSDFERDYLRPGVNGFVSPLLSLSHTHVPVFPELEAFWDFDAAASGSMELFPLSLSLSLSLSFPLRLNGLGN